ncbi:hypothetical protein BDL97_01G206000 [Sphagnum fallax]|nr:hypothetical protein BDL97_01G206000 [Sphagnum fallax]
MYACFMASSSSSSQIPRVITNRRSLVNAILSVESSAEIGEAAEGHEFQAPDRKQGSGFVEPLKKPVKMVNWETAFALSDSVRQKTRRKRSGADLNKEEGAKNSNFIIPANITISFDKSHEEDAHRREIREKFKRLNTKFYQCDALKLAPRLLGKYLSKDDIILQITEVEAYRPGDTACHGRAGCTSRTAPMFKDGGLAYVYLCYGMHNMLNVVADKAGSGAAVLIRSCSPVVGLGMIQQRRKLTSVKPVLLTGPGKVGQALGLTSSEHSGTPLYEPGGLELLDGPKPKAILAGPRVGIDYAAPEDVAAPWRFAIAGTPWVTNRDTLEPVDLADL